MPWTVLFHAAFEPEFNKLASEVQDEILAHALRLEAAGPSLGRPHVDTLNGSVHANMKELRFSSDGGIWRVAFAFDPVRQAILLVAGDKSGQAQHRFYTALIRKADERFAQHIEHIGKQKNDDTQTKTGKSSGRKTKENRRTR